MQSLWSLCIHLSERLPEDDFFISFIIFHPVYARGPVHAVWLCLTSTSTWFFEELNLLRRLWLFHLCWEATQLMEMDGKTVHLIFIWIPECGYFDATASSWISRLRYQMLPTTDWSDWSDSSTGQQLPSENPAACDRSDGLLGLTLGSLAWTPAAYVLQLELDFQGNWYLEKHINPLQTFALRSKISI